MKKVEKRLNPRVDLNLPDGQLGPEVAVSMNETEKVFKQKKSLMPFVLTTMLVGLLCMGGGYLLVNRNTINGGNGGINNMVSVEPSVNNEVKVEQEMEVMEVKYVKKEKALENIKIPSGDLDNIYQPADEDPDFFSFPFSFSKIGEVLTGKYKGGELLMAEVLWSGPCKGPGCDKPFRLRFIKKDNNLIFIPKISSSLVNSFEKTFKVDAFKNLGVTVAIDEKVTVTKLEYPSELRGSDVGWGERVLELVSEYEGEVDATRLEKVLFGSKQGDVYTTMPEYSPKISFIAEGSSWGNKESTADCEGKDCYSTNGFYVFRPDGTYLLYKVPISFKVEEIDWTDALKTGEEYRSYTSVGCDGGGIDFVAVVSPEVVKSDDLVVVGKISENRGVVYGLRDINNKLYSEFYSNYKKNYADFYQYDKAAAESESYEEFINSRPMFFWRDPFGRLIKFSNSQFLPPFACEPIVYLYPEKPVEVSLKFGDKVNVTHSEPAYNKEWKIRAEPSGKLLDVENNKNYPYLFWEGWSYVYPRSDKGFVVRREKVGEFLADKLVDMGLNEQEKQDFMKAWLPEFKMSPYYFITFMNKEDIDRLYPISITPKPDTTIRILMDYKGLDKPMTVESLEIESAPTRKGFVMVEWGGLRR
jgi:hypothetical protein